MLIYVEGLDKLGKTTLINKLKTYYELLDREVEIISPFKTYIGRKLKSLLTTESISDEFRLALAREANLLSVESLDSLFYTDKIVLLDRFVLSTMAYQKDPANFLTERILLRRYSKKMILLFLRCNNFEFIEKKLSVDDVIESSLKDNYEEIQDRYENGIRFMQDFMRPNQTQIFDISNNFVKFDEVIRATNNFEKSILR